MKIWVNTIVNNEENFLYFAVKSVAKYVDKILIWDTGSTDRTVEIIKILKKELGEKIEFKEVGEVDANEFTKLRQQVLEQSKGDWILILDGDEIWWEDSIKKVKKKIEKDGSKIEGIVVPMVVPAGDIYHLQDPKAGRYELLGKKGHFNLRMINKKIPGLHVDWPYGREGYFDENNKLIQLRKDIIFIDAPYLHLTHIPRSTKKRRFDKLKYEIGEKVNKNFKYPEVMYDNYPSIIPNPWKNISSLNLFIAYLITPMRKLKRAIFTE